MLNAVADAMEANLEQLAIAESWDNGKPVRETLGADIPLAIDHLVAQTIPLSDHRC